MEYKLEDLIDIPRLQELLDSLDAVYNLPSAIIDIDGKILTATAWQDICTMFHRVNPETERQCIENDRKIFSEIEKRPPHVIYKCPRGLVDTVTPIIIEDRHYGNAFTGQLFLETPDENDFRRQARQYGFDEEKYIEAMRKVPVITEDRLKQNLYIVRNLAVMLAEFGLRQKRQLVAEEKIKAREKWFRELFEGAPDAVFIADAGSGEIIDANKQAGLLLGRAIDELIGLNQTDLHPADQKEKSRSNFRERAETIPVSKPVEHSIIRPDGTVVPVEILAHPFEVEGRKVLMGTFRDITERKSVNEKLRKSLHEKEMLLKEVHHRVKNNMAVISSLLSLQAEYFQDEKYRLMFLESRSRIRSMALVHEKLYKSDNFQNIDVGEYLRDLVSSIAAAFGSGKNIKTHIDAANVFLDIDTLIPFGLLINELLTNSFKHAFPDRPDPRIDISVKRIDMNMELAVSDNGAGIPDGVDINTAKGLGLKLVKALSEQINGTLRMHNDNGASFHLVFPVKIDFSKV